MGSRHVFYHANVLSESDQIFFLPQELDERAVLNKYEKLSFPESKQVTEVVPESLEDYLYKDGNGFKQLILELTTACNLRCKYCIYSEYYPNTREHGNTIMSFEVAKKAIDYYFKHFDIISYRNPMKQPIISFYGGEPLMALHRLREILRYIDRVYGAYDVIYNITTNGLMFNEEAQALLDQYNFAILVSLDGYRENHDRNRVDVSGKGSFDRIMKNISHYKAKYPEKTITVSACFDFKTDLEKLGTFFDDENILVSNIAQVQASNSTYYQQFGEEDSENMVNTFLAIKNKFFKQIEENNIEKESFIYRYFSAMYGDFSYHPMGFEGQPDIKPYTGTCIPGEKLYVDVNGHFKICEKINSSYSIGNIDTGLDYDSICKVINDYNQVLKGRCESCSISKLCKLCFKDFDGESGFKEDLSICAEQKSRTKKMLEEYVTLMEMNPTMFEEITMDYYSLLTEMGDLA